MKKILISAGEASGDFYGAELAKELRKKHGRKVEILGFGGPRMRAAGIDVRLDLVSHAAMGIWEVLVNIVTHLKLYKMALETVKNERPDCLVVIDSPSFHMPLIKDAKKAGIKKVVYYSTPQVWVWKKGRIKGLKKYTDLCIVILPFEEKILNEAGVRAKYFGHPMAPFMKPAKPSSSEKLIGIFPGSRKNEITGFFEDILKACALVRMNYKKAKFVLFKAETIDSELLQPLLNKYSGLKIEVAEGSNMGLKSSLHAAIAKSGTTTLELALMGVPMAIVYRIAAISYILIRPRAKGRFVGLPNIYLNKEVVKEFIQHELKPENVSAEILKIINNKAYSDSIKKDFSMLREKHGESKNVVKLIARAVASEAGL